mgnify:CR=1 FL=1
MFGKKIELMCEIASNHQGCLHRLMVLTDYAANAGFADFLKVQIWSAKNLYVEDSDKLSVFERLELSDEAWHQYLDCFPYDRLRLVIEPFDTRFIDFASPRHEIEICKIPPSRILDRRFLETLADCSFISTFFLGVSGAYIGEIERALDILGDRCKKMIYGYQNFPSKVDLVNFGKIRALKERFNLDIGYADHSETTDSRNFSAVVAALANGASLIEKHICLSHCANEVDHVSALTPDEFKRFSKQIEVFNKHGRYENCLDLTDEEMNYRSQMFCFPRSSEKVSETKVRAVEGTSFFRDGCNASLRCDEFV